MSDKIGVLVIHGMGSQRRGFANDLIDEISDRLDDDADSLIWREIYWADALKPREDELWEWMKKAKEPDGSAIALDWQTIREFVIHNFGDAAAYHRDSEEKKGAYSAINGIVSAEVKALKKSLNDADAPMVVVAHSLGAHIMSSYIWDRQHWKSDAPDKLETIPNLAGMVTFGCNIPLFSLAFTLAKPIDFPGKGVKKPALKAAAKWLNYLDRDDVLGWPLKTLYEKNLNKLNMRQKETVARIEDHEINVGSLVTSWNPAAHAGYWTDNDFTRPVGAFLRSVIRAAEA